MHARIQIQLVFHPCSLLYGGEDQSKYCWILLLVRPFHSRPLHLMPSHGHFMSLHTVLTPQLRPCPSSVSLLFLCFCNIPTGIRSTSPANLIRLLTKPPVKPISFITSFILFLSTVFVLAIIQAQLFSQLCSFIRLVYQHILYGCTLLEACSICIPLST